MVSFRTPQALCRVKFKAARPKRGAAKTYLANGVTTVGSSAHSLQSKGLGQVTSEFHYQLHVNVCSDQGVTDLLQELINNLVREGREG